MDSALFDELQRLVKTEGAPAAFDRLCADLRRRKESTPIGVGRKSSSSK